MIYVWKTHYHDKLVYEADDTVALPDTIWRESIHIDAARALVCINTTTRQRTNARAASDRNKVTPHS